MLNISFTEFLVFCILAILILGPEKLPSALRRAHQGYKRIRYFYNSSFYHFENELKNGFDQISSKKDRYQGMHPIYACPYQAAFIQTLLNSSHSCNIQIIETVANASIRQALIHCKKPKFSLTLTTDQDTTSLLVKDVA